MAIYEFVCTICGSKFEDLIMGNGASSVKCPKCGARDVKRLLSVFGYSGGSGFKSSSASSGGCSSCGGGSCSTCH